MKFLKWLIRKVIFLTLGLFVVVFMYSKYSKNDETIKDKTEISIFEKLESLEPMACDSIINLARYVSAKNDKDTQGISDLMEKNCTLIGGKALGNDVIKNLTIRVKGEDQVSCLLELEISGVSSKVYIFREDENQDCHDLISSYY